MERALGSVGGDIGISRFGSPSVSGSMAQQKVQIDRVYSDQSGGSAGPPRVDAPLVRPPHRSVSTNDM